MIISDQPQALAPVAPPAKEPPEAEESVKRTVKRWTRLIKAARDEDYEADFERMRENMEFTSGIQWADQASITYERYVSNLVNRTVNQKVALLYARDPKAIARRRKRLEFALWDGKLESLAAAVQRATTSEMYGLPPDLESLALIRDYEMGIQMREIVDRVGKTLEVAYQYEVDEQDPAFKLQMKQLVRRVVVCGVAYAKLGYESDLDPTAQDIGSSDGVSVTNRARRARALLEEIAEKGFDKEAEETEELKTLLRSLEVSSTVSRPENERPPERLTFDFLPATSVIPDPNCRCLKGFVGAHWVAQELILPLDYVNAFFEKDIKPGGELVSYKEGKEEHEAQTSVEESPQREEVSVCLWIIYDKDTNSQFTIVDGYSDFIEPPAPVEPAVRGFWPIEALTFNDIEVEEGQKATIFPPSDVDLMKHAQKEWNRTREALRDQRKANAPKYMTGKGWLTDKDMANLESAVPNQVIEIEGASRGEDVNILLAPFKHAPVDPALYDTKPLSDDIMFASGTQEANLGPAKPNVTATVGSIAEQSRMSMASSNVDDLDDFLSRLAKMGGEIMLRYFSTETIKRIVGPGAVWPEANKTDFLNAVYLEVMAASSGRPNKMLEIQNAERIGPLLLQAGANPMFLVRELIKRLDDRLDPEEAFPLAQMTSPMPMAQPSPPQTEEGKAKPNGRTNKQRR